MKKLLLASLAILCLFACTKKSAKEAFVDNLMEKMTLQEKIGQTVLFSSDWDITGPVIKGNYEEDVRSGRCGAVFNAYTVKYVEKVQRLAVEESRLGIPLIFGYDVIHGHKTIFPIPLGESSSWDLKAMEESSRIAAIEASAEGLNWTFAPMVDITRDPRWGRVCEGAGEDKYLGIQAAKARVKGFQGSNLSDNNTILACAKHFAAYGAAQAGRDYNTVDISKRELRETYLPPFKACVDVGCATFMTSFNELDGIPSSGNKFLLKDILRDEWGFKGFVVTDFTSINEMVKHGICKDEYDAGKLSIQSGVDMDMQGSIYYKYLEEMVKKNEVSEETVNTACRNILNLKYDLGLFADPYKYCNLQREKDLVMCKEHQDKAREIGAKSIVLLKNDKKVLPLNAGKKIAVIGELANRKDDMIGSWSAAGDGQKSITLLEGLKAQYSNNKITYTEGCKVKGTDKSGFAKAISAAKKADIILYAMGEYRGMSGE
ncbi:MAG: glycoside hydrolase family 3 N-terminal domain-containing protein, partial [Marinifilaceae bacterium]